MNETGCEASGRSRCCRGRGCRGAGRRGRWTFRRRRRARARRAQAHPRRRGEHRLQLVPGNGAVAEIGTCCRFSSRCVAVTFTVCSSVVLVGCVLAGVAASCASTAETGRPRASVIDKASTAERDGRATDIRFSPVGKATIRSRIVIQGWRRRKRQVPIHWQQPDPSPSKICPCPCPCGPEYMPLHDFHPAVAAWFRARFPRRPRRRPRPGRRSAPAAHADRRADRLGQDAGRVPRRDRRAGARRRGARRLLPDETAVVYVSPLKALSNDIRINLEAPLAGIRAELEKLGLPDVAIRTAVRTGDTPQAERDMLRKQPPHILVTTPESLYILLGSESGRAMLSTHAHGDRRRDPRARRQQARQRTWRCRWSGWRRCAGGGCCASACRRRRSRSRRWRASWSAPAERRRADAHAASATHRRHRPHAAQRDLALEVPPVPLRSGDVERHLGAGLRPRSPQLVAGAPHHAGLRQHAAHGRARRAASGRAARQGSTSPRTTAAWRRSCASTPSSG